MSTALQLAASGPGPDGPHTGGSRTKDQEFTPDELAAEYADELQGRTHTRAEYADVASLMSGTLPDAPKPEYGKRTDGAFMIYKAQVNFLFGDPESGKTWVALASSVHALNRGEKVLVLDLDHNGLTATVSRLIDLGADHAALADVDRFRYIEPDDRHELSDVVDDSAEWQPDVAIVDSLGELIPMFGGSSNSGDDFTHVHAQVLKPLAKAGAAVILIDHQAKNSDSRSFGPGGTVAKKRACGGSMIRVTVKDAFTKGRGGSAVLSVTKDRHSGVRENAVGGGREPMFGMFRLKVFHTPEGDTLLAEIDPPKDGESAPTDHSLSAQSSASAAADADELDALDPAPQNRRDVMARMSWGSDRATNALREWRDRHGD